MRVNPNIHTNLLSSLQRVSEDEGIALKQMSSGKRVERPSDDPAAMADVVELQSLDARNEQYLSNVGSMRSRMQFADSTLSSVVTGLQRAVTLGVGGANGTLNDSGREAMAQEIDGIYAHVLDLSNASLQGTYLFAGTASTTKPFTASSAGDITYNGSDSNNQVQIGEGLWIADGVPGTSLFGADGSNVFGALKNLSAAIRSGSDVPGAIAATKASLDAVSAARVAYGNSMNQLDAAELVMKGRHTQLTQQLTDVAGTDLAEVITRVSSAEIARNALLGTISKAGSLSLFDYLK